MNTVRRRVGLAVFGALVLTLPLSACSNSGGKPVAVTLKDYSVMASPDSVAAGEVTFTVKNDGSFVHEMLVIKADSPAALPLKADGTVNEDALGEESIPGEASDINPGATAKLTLKLSAGKYLLVCNRVDGTKRHYHEGMVTSFTVV